MGRRMWLVVLIYLLASLLMTQAADASTVSVTSFGAKCDGKKDDTIAIRAALAAAQPGDVVSFPANKTCKITDELRPKAGTTLQGLPGSRIVQAGNRHLLVIAADDVSTNNLRLRHEGTARTSNVIRVEGAARFYLYNTTIERSDSWNVYLLGGCHDGTINGLVILPGRKGNGDDGLDIAECHDVTAQRLDIYTNDDAVSFKSYDNGFGGTHHVTVTDSRLRSDYAAAVGFGNEIYDPLYAIDVNDVDIVESLHGVYFRLTTNPVSGRTADASKISDVEIYNVRHVDTAARWNNPQLVKDGVRWPQDFVFVQKYEAAGSMTNVRIHDYTYSGEPWDGVHVMRTSGISISSLVATVPARDSRYAVWLEAADGNSFDMVTDGFPGGIREDASSGNTFTGTYH